MVDTTFIDDLASSAPTPGGGGASAYCGALASALASMVGNLTLGKKKYATVEEEIAAVMAQLSEKRAQLLDLIDQDARAFEPLAQTYRMPSTTPEEQQAKHTAQQAALIDAIEVPLAIMRTCADVLDLTDVMAKKGSRLAVSDAGVAAVFARAAIEGASLNIFINVASLEDSAQAQAYERAARDLIAENQTKAQALFAYVCDEIG